MQTLDAVSTSNDYGNVATISDVYNSSGGFALVSGADAYMELQYGQLGTLEWTREVHVGANSPIALQAGTIGVRFRSYKTGTPATVSGALAGEGEPPIVLTSPGTVSISGGSSLNVAARIHATGRNDALTNTGWNACSLPVVDYATDPTMTASLSSITVPVGGTGIYVISAAVQFNVNPTVYSLIRILRNGSLIGGVEYVGAQDAGTQAAGPAWTDHGKLSVGDVITMQVWQNATGTYYAGNLAIAQVATG